MAQQLFVRLSAESHKILGPFSPAQLKQLAAKGKLLPTHEVSFDKKRWVSASKVKPPLFGTKSRQPPKHQSENSPAEQGTSQSDVQEKAAQASALSPDPPSKSMATTDTAIDARRTDKRGIRFGLYGALAGAILYVLMTVFGGTNEVALLARSVDALFWAAVGGAVAHLYGQSRGQSRVPLESNADLGRSPFRRLVLIGCVGALIGISPIGMRNLAVFIPSSMAETFPVLTIWFVSMLGLISGSILTVGTWGVSPHAAGEVIKSTRIRRLYVYVTAGAALGLLVAALIAVYGNPTSYTSLSPFPSRSMYEYILMIIVSWMARGVFAVLGASVGWACYSAARSVSKEATVETRPAVSDSKVPPAEVGQLAANLDSPDRYPAPTPVASLPTREADKSISRLVAVSTACAAGLALFLMSSSLVGGAAHSVLNQHAYSYYGMFEYSVSEYSGPDVPRAYRGSFSGSYPVAMVCVYGLLLPGLATVGFFARKVDALIGRAGILSIVAGAAISLMIVYISPSLSVRNNKLREFMPESSIPLFTGNSTLLTQVILFSVLTPVICGSLFFFWTLRFAWRRQLKYLAFLACLAVSLGLLCAVAKSVGSGAGDWPVVGLFQGPDSANPYDPTPVGSIWPRMLVQAFFTFLLFSQVTFGVLVLSAIVLCSIDGVIKEYVSQQDDCAKDIVQEERPFGVYEGLMLLLMFLGWFIAVAIGGFAAHFVAPLIAGEGSILFDWIMHLTRVTVGIGAAWALFAIARKYFRPRTTVLSSLYDRDTIRQGVVLFVATTGFGVFVWIARLVILQFTSYVIVSDANSNDRAQYWHS